jgi:2,3-bisphosphoglycerate-independent phosphoglycerate mutase
MKYAIVIMDGAADEPLDELGGQTILERASIPNTDWISSHGRQGMVQTVPKGMAPGSDVAVMSLLGYDPKECYTGRAPLEAAAQGIETAQSDWIFRCNLVTVADGLMRDHSAGHIDNVQALQLIADLNEQLGSDEVTFYPGVRYRHLMVHRGGPFDMELAPPHEILDEPVAKYIPRGKGGKVLAKIMERAAKILGEHEVNKVRRDLNENPATNIWLWGQGHKARLEGFRQKFGVSAAVITAVDLLRGLASLMGMTKIEVEGATGFIDTNFVGKGAKAIEALESHDLVIVHVEAPDEAGHSGRADVKLDAVEKIDRHVVGPLLEALKEQGQWRMMVLPDHPTPISMRGHSGDAVPFALAGEDVSGVLHEPYSEANGARSGLRIERGFELMEYFLQSKG